MILLLLSFRTRGQDTETDVVMMTRCEQIDGRGVWGARAGCGAPALCMIRERPEAAKRSQHEKARSSRVARVILEHLGFRT